MVGNTNGQFQTILVEEVTQQFSSGAYVLPGKTGYKLVNAYAINRPTTENNDYAITSIYGRSDGTYRLENKLSTLGASLTMRLIWVMG